MIKTKTTYKLQCDQCDKVKEHKSDSEMSQKDLAREVKWIDLIRPSEHRRSDETPKHNQFCCQDCMIDYWKEYWGSEVLKIEKEYNKA